MRDPRWKYFKASLAAAASGLTVSTAQAAIITTAQDSTLVWDLDDITPNELSFDITGDATDDYRFTFQDNNARKPAIQSYPFPGRDAGNYAQQQIMLPLVDVAGKPSNTLPVLPDGATVDSSLFGGYSFQEAYFFMNYEKNYYGDWGGPGGDAINPGDNSIPPTFPVEGPVEGYVGLRIETAQGSGQWNYGYAHVRVDVTGAVVEEGGLPGARITLLGTGYETEVDTPISIVSVPEPASLSAFVLGAVGLAGLRRWRHSRN